MQYGRLNMGLLRDYIDFHYLCTFAARKNHFAAVFFIMYACEYLIYRKTPKSVLFAVYRLFLARQKVLSFMFAFFAAVFVFYMYVSTIFSYWYVCIRLFSVFVFTRFLFHENCVKHYASFCIFMQSKNVCLCNVLW